MVSILLPSYNGSKYIRESVVSILNQTFTDFELLIGFNGTTDTSKEIVYKIINDIKDPDLIESINSKVRVIDYGDDKGKAKTLNKLLKEAKYNLIALQDDDDLWHSDKLQIQMNFIDNFDVVGTFLNYIDHNGLIIKKLNLQQEDSGIKYWSLERGINNVANTSALFKKSIAEEIGGWREDIDGIEDFDFWIRLMKQGNSFFNVPEYLLYHRIHNESNFNTKKQDISKIL